MTRTFILLAILAASVGAQPTEIYTIGGDVTSPVMTRQSEPSYSKEGRAAAVSGEVWLEAIIDSAGLPKDIAVISPLGFGLDEEAIAAVQKWRFRPATRFGKPVDVRATIAVAFHLVGADYDPNAERRRSGFNVAMRELELGDASRKRHGKESLQELSAEKFPPAMFAYAELLRLDNPPDLATAAKLVRAAAEGKYGPAMFEVGRQLFFGEGVTMERERGLKMIVAAARTGSNGAQFMLGANFETGGQGLDMDIEKAQENFRLCAAGGQGLCQYRLGRLLLNRAGRRESDLLQAVAWLELAQAQGLQNALSLRSSLPTGVTPKQRSEVDELKRKLVRKN